MKHISIAVFFSILITGHVTAAQQDGADNKGTVHFGIKLGPTNVMNNPSGMGLYGGYTLYGPGEFRGNAHLEKVSVAIEGEHVDLGRSQNATEKADTFGFLAAATYPITPELSAIAKLGVAGVFRKYSHSLRYSTTYTGIHGAAAVQIRLTPIMSFRAGYDFYPGDYNMTSASLIYKY